VSADPSIEVRPFDARIPIESSAALTGHSRDLETTSLQRLTIKVADVLEGMAIPGG
jgi:hypothetical protein